MKPANMVLALGILGVIASAAMMVTVRQPGFEAFCTGSFALSMGTVGLADLWRRRQATAQWTTQRTLFALAFAGTYLAIMVILATFLGGD